MLSDCENAPGDKPGRLQVKYFPLNRYIARSAAALWEFVPGVNKLLVFVPFALLSDWFGAPDWLIFSSALLGLVPLSALLGVTTEALASYTSGTVGGLLNASLGNLPELIISMIALRAASPSNSMLRVVQLSLLGSILSNLLLVLGTSIVVGGLRNRIQLLNKHAVSAFFAALLLSTAALMLPTMLVSTRAVSNCAALALSRASSVVLLAVYAAFLVFQLKTHTDLFEDQGDEEGSDPEHEDQTLGMGGSAFWMICISLLISVLSEEVVDSLEQTSTVWGVPRLFIAAIVIPIVGNAAEHSTAVYCAYRGKLDITIGVALGSAAQIALFVLPAIILWSTVLGLPLSLDLQPFECVAGILAVVVTGLVCSKSAVTWLHGFVLVALYILISLGFFFHESSPDWRIPDPKVDSSKVVLTGGIDAGCANPFICGWEGIECGVTVDEASRLQVTLPMVSTPHGKN